MENCYVSDDNEWNAKERIYLFNAELNPKHLYKELEWYDLIEFFGGNDSVKLFFFLLSKGRIKMVGILLHSNELKSVMC